MELAMHCRDSDSRWFVRGPYGSEWTVGSRHGLLLVAFPGSVRQQLLEPSEEPRKKVASFGWCYSLRCASSGSTEASRHMLSFGLASSFTVGCQPWRTACSAFEPRLAVEGMSAHTVPRLLTVIWFHATRLETRTKESNMCASLWVIETRRHNESKGCLQLK